MNQGRLIFTQMIDLLDRKELERCLQRHPMPRASRSFSGRDQFLTMAFAQATFREGLRDIEACLRGSPRLYAMGIRGNVTRTNIAYANENRPWQVYADLAQVLIRKARRLYHNDATELNLDEIVYALDSTTIDLCLSMFPWAKFRQTKAAVKMHTQIDLRGSIPVFISITDVKVHDVHFLDQIIIEPGSIYVMDRAYVDFVRLYRIHCEWAFFVTRTKINMRFYVVESRPVDRSSGVRCDQTIRLNGPKSKHLYPDKLRRIRFIDPESGATLVFLTNNFKLPPLTIAAIYKSRWYIELFFKWIKQNLRIKAFHGTSENALKTRIWIAICVYLLVACLKKVHRIDQSLSWILQVISVNVFQKDPLHQLLGEFVTSNPGVGDSNQLMLNGF